MTDSSENNHQTGDANTVWREDGDDGVMENANSLFMRPNNQSPNDSATSDEGDNTGDNKDTNSDGEVVPAKRYFDLKKHHDQVVSELRREVQELKANPATSVSDEPSKENEMLKEFKDKNPEEYEKMLAVVRGEVAPHLQGLEQEVNTLKERESKIKKDEALSQLKKAHPDFDQIVADDNFHYWAESQTKEIQEWIYNNPYNAELAIAAIDLYKARQAKQQEDTQDNKDSQDDSQQSSADAASLVNSRTRGADDSTNKKVWTKEEIRKMSPDEWEKHRHEIYAQLGGGR